MIIQRDQHLIAAKNLSTVFLSLLQSNSKIARKDVERSDGCRYLAENEKNRELIREAGGLRPLTKMFLESWGSTPELQELACKCLLNLSICSGKCLHTKQAVV